MNEQHAATTLDIAVSHADRLTAHGEGARQEASSQRRSRRTVKRLETRHITQPTKALNRVAA